MSLGNIRVGAILPGKIVRITDYGAFCELNIGHDDHRFGDRGKNYRPIRGLIHISQLSSTRVENVNDVVSMDDSVWVKVLDISEYDAATPNSDNNTDRHHTSHRNPRHKVSLSLKDASQDGSARDLAEEESNEQQQRLKSSTQMESSLNSTIGMGIARDPMDPMAQRILLKQDKKMGKGALINGYSLVDDTEGEPCPPAIAEPNASAMKRASTAITDGGGSGRLAPMGRGRGATLPAWMTQPKLESEDNRAEGPVGIRSQQQRQTEGSTSDDEVNRGGHHHRHRQKKKKSHKDYKRKDKKRSSRRDRHRRRHKHSKHVRRKERRKESDDWSDDNSRSSSRSTRPSRSDDSSRESGGHSKIRHYSIDSSHGEGSRFKRNRERSTLSRREDSRNKTGRRNDGCEDRNRQDESDSKRHKSYSKNERRHHTEDGNNLSDDDQSLSSIDSREENDRKSGGSKRGKSRKQREREDSTKDERRRHLSRRHNRSHSDDEVSDSSGGSDRRHNKRMRKTPSRRV